MLNQKLHDAHVHLCKVNKELSEVIEFWEARGKSPKYSAQYWPLKNELDVAYKKYMELLRESQARNNAQTILN